jgi:glutamate N-acetyltransferase/amino-acid N-acetyltransferase
MTDVEFVSDGGVTSPKGFVAGGVYSGIKTSGPGKLDLGILMSERPCLAVGTYTLNLIKSGSLVLTQERVEAGRVRAVVASSGIANAVVEAGHRDAIELTDLAARHVGLDPDEMAVCTTGLIGVELPMALIRAGMPKVELTHGDGGDAFARSILTTDRRAKSAAVRCEIDGHRITIGGCVKGSGMIHPNMATMLAFLTTDAAVKPELLRSALSEVVDETFNMVSVDGDSSTNDTVLLFANGEAGNAPLNSESPGAAAFTAALRELSGHLCKELVRDAEGSERIFSVQVEEAASRDDARAIARTVASSSLVKSAIHGNDPNWGRVIAAAGRAGAAIEEKKISFFINDVCLMEHGLPISFHKEAIISIMNNPEVELTLRLGLGSSSAAAWGCELTEGYVTFNSAYTT